MLEPGVCIGLLYNEMQNINGIEEKMVAECDGLIAPHEYHQMIRFRFVVAAAKERL